MSTSAVDLAAAWAERYGDEPVPLLAPLPVWDAPVNTEAEAAAIVGAIQLHEGTAARIRAQYEAVAAQHERMAEFLRERFGGRLREFTQRETDGAKTKSVKLVTGQGGDKPVMLKFRTVPGTLKIVDPKAAEDWVAGEIDPTEHADWLRVVPETCKPIAAKFKQHHAETGEIPPGCETVPKREAFYVDGKEAET